MYKKHYIIIGIIKTEQNYYYFADIFGFTSEMFIIIIFQIFMLLLYRYIIMSHFVTNFVALSII